MKTLTQLQREIKAGRNMEENLSAFLNGFASTNYVYASMQFAMHYYDIYEADKDGDLSLSEDANGILTEINTIIKENILSDFDGIKRENAVKRLNILRNDISFVMEKLTFYADHFLLYEYVLKRMSMNYSDEIFPVDNELAAAEVMRYIFDGSDSPEINRKIREALYVLPVRMTKNKFYDLVSDSVSMYNGSKQQDVLNYIFRIRSAAALNNDPIKNEEISRLLEMFAAADYRDLKEEEYNNLQQELERITTYIADETDCYYTMQELLNSLYAVLLNLPYVSSNEQAFIRRLKPLVLAVFEGFEAKCINIKKDIPLELIDLFELTEGKIEQYAESIKNQQDLLDEIEVNHKEKVYSLMLRSLLESLLLTKKLISNSLFIDFDEDKNTLTADRNFIEKKASELIEELSKRLETQQKAVNKAMIASVLKELPVLFKNREAVVDYIKNSLSGCHDMAEKAVTMQLIRELIMTEAEYM